MFRIQSCAIYLLLLAIESQSFAAVFRRSQCRFARSFQTEQRTQSTTRKRQLSSSPAFLYSAQFQSNEGGVESVNNRHSASDYWHNIKTMPNSSILRDIRNPVLAVFGWSTAISVLHFVLAKSGRVALQAMASRLSISSSMHSFLISSLGLLLVFRTNSAYQRFNEGRKIWEQILSVSRNLTRLTKLYGREIGSKRRTRLRNLIAAYPYLLRHHIREGCLCEDDTVDAHYRLRLEEPALQMVPTRHEGDKRCGGITHPQDTAPPPKECWVDRRNLPWSLLTPGALDKVARVRNRPLWICDRLGREICDIPYCDNFTNRERQHFLSHVEKLTDALGKCERIHQTPTPLNYARHCLRALSVWMFTLPFALVKDFGFMTGPAAGIIAWLMFGIYQIGYNIEDPFQGSLRLSMLCDAIRSDVMGYEADEDDFETSESAHSRWAETASINSLPLHPPSQVLSLVTPTPSPLFTVAEFQ